MYFLNKSKTNPSLELNFPTIMKITTNLVENFPVFLVNLIQYIHNQFVISLGWIQVGQPKKKEAVPIIRGGFFMPEKQRVKRAQCIDKAKNKLA